VAGTGELNRIDLIFNGLVAQMMAIEDGTQIAIAKWEKNGVNVLRQSGCEAMMRGKENCFYVRVRQEDGHMAWSSPIWVSYPA